MKCETVEVAATLIARGEKLLVIFNERWGAFTFPMSRRKLFRDSSVSAAGRPENWSRAAARVAAEVLGRTFVEAEFPKPLCEIKEFEQSDADGIWKLYDIQIFGLKAPREAETPAGLVAEWLSPKELKEREPISRTARFVLKGLEEQRLLPPWKA